MYVRDDIWNRRLRSYEDNGFSNVWIPVDSGMGKSDYACVYRSYSSDQETTRFFDHLTEMVDKAQQRYLLAELIFLGDFNAHHNEWLFPSEETDHAG